eukprot:TRINITY_DN681_c0_g1_i1.p1 TRINITY_DN681_c0_g1~~TRINITY_DN681_c0_g1_i1.p1  ORF type:complete len:801 (-),score=125.62 TRINITY_DN681_c0_g1_i1:584-2986(-)
MTKRLTVSAQYESHPNARRDPQALVIVLDTHTPSTHVFEQLKSAAARLARTRLIYNASKDDLISVIRSGSSVTSNELNKEKGAGYGGIHVVVPPVSRSLVAVNALELSQRGTNTSNLLNILDVCGFYLSMTAAKRARENRVILLTAGRCVYRQLDQEIIQDFQQQCILFRQERIKVDIIYHCSTQSVQKIADLQQHFAQIQQDVPVQQVVDRCNSSEIAFLFLITSITNGRLLPYEHAAPLIDLPTPRIKKAAAKFRGVLNIADVIKIPVKRYSHVYPAKHPTSKKLSWNVSKAKSEPVPVLTETQRVASAKDDAPLQKEDIINAYPYGSELVPESNEVDKYAWHIQLEKGLDVIGFVPQCSVPRTVLLSPVDVLLPMKGCEPAQRLMHSLVLALAAEKMGILARSVVSERGAPHMAYLWPSIEVEQNTNENANENTGMLGRCFLFVANIAMKEDIRHFPFASLDDVLKDVPEDAVDTMDSFISSAFVDEDATDDSDDEDDPIWPPDLCNPNLDWFHICIVHRALAGAEATDFPPLSQWHLDIMDPIHYLKESNKEQFEKNLEALSKVLPLTQALRKEKKFKPVHEAVAGDDAVLQEYLPRDETEQQEKGGENDEEDIEDVDVGHINESLRDIDDVTSQITDLGVEDVSEERPESDFAALVKKGQFRFASASLIVIIQRLIREEKDIEKVIRCIKLLRKAGIKNEQPRVFNDFISSLVNRCSQDNSTAKKTKAFFTQLGSRGESRSVSVIPFKENTQGKGLNPSHLGLMRHLERLSIRVNELTSQAKQESLLGAVASAES